MAFSDEEKTELVEIYKTGFLSGMQAWAEKVQADEAAQEAAEAAANANKPPVKSAPKGAERTGIRKIFGSLT